PGRTRMENAGAHGFASLIDRSRQECLPASLNGLGQGAIDGLELLRRAATRPGPERHDRRLREGGELQRGLSLDQASELARQRVATNDLIDDAATTASGDGRPRPQRAKWPRLLRTVLGEGTDLRAGVLAQV